MPSLRWHRDIPFAAEFLPLSINDARSRRVCHVLQTFNTRVSGKAAAPWPFPQQLPEAKDGHLQTNTGKDPCSFGGFLWTDLHQLAMVRHGRMGCVVDFAAARGRRDLQPGRVRPVRSHHVERSTTATSPACPPGQDSGRFHYYLQRALGPGAQDGHRRQGHGVSTSDVDSGRRQPRRICRSSRANRRWLYHPWTGMGWPPALR